VQKSKDFQAVLTPRQRAAVAALFQAKTRQEAAEICGVSQSTLYKWLRNPIFKAELLELETETRQTLRRRLSRGAGASLDTIAEIRDDQENPPALRLRAADLWLTHHEKLDDQSDFDRRLTALEERV